MERTGAQSRRLVSQFIPNHPTKIIPTRFVDSNNFHEVPCGRTVDMRIAPLRIKILLESNSLKSMILVRRLAVTSRP